jgi:outer membrane protein TolC
MMTCNARPGVAALALAALLAAGAASGAAEGDSDKAKALLKERLATLKLVADRLEAGYKAGTVPVADLMQAAEAVLKAELDLCETAKERVAVLVKLVESAKRREGLVEKMVKAAQATGTDLLRAKASRLEAEIALERARRMK